MTKHLLIAALLGAPVAALGQGASVDLEKRIVRAKGQGSPDAKAANVSSARLGAEAAAKMDALRNIIEALKGVQIEAGRTAGQDPAVRAKVEGLAANFKIVGPCTKSNKRAAEDPGGEPAPCYYSDGGVEIEVEMALDDGLVASLQPKSKGGKK